MIRVRIDDKGRVRIPARIREDMLLAPGDLLDIEMQGDTMTLSRSIERCTLCGEGIEEESVYYEIDAGILPRKICEKCAIQIANATGR